MRASSAGLRPAASSSTSRQPRRGRERAGEVERLLLGAVEIAGGALGEAVELERGEQRIDVGRIHADFAAHLAVVPWP